MLSFRSALVLWPWALVLLAAPSRAENCHAQVENLGVKIVEKSIFVSIGVKTDAPSASTKYVEVRVWVKYVNEGDTIIKHHWGPFPAYLSSGETDKTFEKELPTLDKVSQIISVDLDRITCDRH